MNWEQEFQACQALCEHTLRMRKPGDWYVSALGLNVKEGPFLCGRYGNGDSPIAAISDHWTKITNLKDDEYLVVDSYKGRQAVKWNGFMWEPVIEEKPEAKS
jgi:hypothetical protein